jgi:hypothetical protein
MIAGGLPRLAPKQLPAFRGAPGFIARPALIFERFFAVETFPGTFLPAIIPALFLLKLSSSFTTSVLRSTTFVVIVIFQPTHYATCLLP